MAILDVSYATGGDATAKLRQGTIIYLAQQFLPTKSGSVDQIEIQIRKNGSPTGNVWVEIWSDTGSDVPNAVLGGASGNVDVSTLSTDALGAFQAFTWSTNLPPITAGTKYWIIFAGDYTQDTNNCAQWIVDTDGSGGASPGEAYSATAGPTWSDSGPGVARLFKEYYQAAGTSDDLFGMGEF